MSKSVYKNDSIFLNVCKDLQDGHQASYYLCKILQDRVLINVSSEGNEILIFQEERMYFEHHV